MREAEGTLIASRVHWPTVARTGRPAERVVTPEFDRGPLVVLDTRAPAPESAVDAAVRAAASITVALARCGGARILVCDAAGAWTVDEHLAGWPHVHARLAAIGRGRSIAWRAIDGAAPVIWVAPVAASPETHQRRADFVAAPEPLGVPLFAVGGCSVCSVRGGSVNAPALRAASPERAPAGAPLAVRATAFVLFAAYAAYAFGRVVPGVALGTGLFTAVIAVAAGCGVWSVARSHGAGALALAVLIALAAFTAALLVIGIPAALLLPWHGPCRQGDLARSRGPLAGHLALPRSLVDTDAYRRGNGGCPDRSGLRVSRSRASARERRRVACAAILTLLVIAGLANSPAGAWRVQGALVALLLVAVLFAPAMRAIDTARALAWTCAVLAAALVAAPLLNRGLTALASGSAAARGLTFEWNELYGPLGWSRSTRRVLTVSATQRPLVRVTSLDRFDGVRFLRSDSPPSTTALEARLARLHPQWVQAAWFVNDGLTHNSSPRRTARRSPSRDSPARPCARATGPLNGLGHCRRAR